MYEILTTNISVQQVPQSPVSKSTPPLKSQVRMNKMVKEYSVDHQPSLNQKDASFQISIDFLGLYLSPE